MSAPTGEVERIDAKVRELREAGALDEDTLTEVGDLLGEITARFTALEHIIERKIDALKAQQS